LYHNLKQEDIKLLNDGFGSKISDTAFEERNVDYFIKQYEYNRAVLSEFRSIKNALERIL